MCEHGENRQQWVNNPYAWDEEDDMELIEEWVSWDVDLDLHRYQCTGCGRIGFYSGAARGHFENGTSYNIKGLE